MCNIVIYNVFLMGKGRSCAVYIIFCIRVYKRPHYGSQLEPKHVTLNKLKKKNTSVVCD